MKKNREHFCKKDELHARAFYFALKAHEGQNRKGTGRPYIEHPYRVAGKLLEIGASPELVAAGFLHDVLEDTKGSFEDIRHLFGNKTAGFVKHVSEDKTLPWKDRKTHTIRHLGKAPYAVVVLTCADKLDNISSIRRDYENSGESLWSRFHHPKSDQQWYYTSLGKVFNRRMKGKKEYPLCEEYLSNAQAVFNPAKAPATKNTK